jgi:hypothetical protein
LSRLLCQTYTGNAIVTSDTSSGTLHVSGTATVTGALTGVGGATITTGGLNVMAGGATILST